MNALIIDGYVDEPACFGVPPYISPYVRYAAGALYSHGYEVSYRTCDEWRRLPDDERRELLRSHKLVVVIMGTTVPGRYRGGSPMTLRELEAAASSPRGGAMVLTGPVVSGYTLRGGTQARMALPGGVLVSRGDIDASLDIYCRSGEWREYARRDYARLDELAPQGAPVVKLHPMYPDVIAEMELSRGCDRTGGRCSFCTESGAYEERSAEGVSREFRALAEAGIGAFRLGRCANILAWGGDATGRGRRPSGKRIEELYSAIRSAAPNLSVLHTDNCNPLTLSRFPDESRAALEAIVRHNTEGDGLSLGIECLDPEVVRLNGLKVTPEEAMLAVRIVNEIGFMRRSPRALPALLPGLNFVVGLAGDSGESLLWNRRLLEALLGEGLTVRRINIRRAMVFPGTPLAALKASHPSRVREREYRRWKEWVRGEVDPLMLERVAPDGTILRGVIAEERRGGLLFGRQLGSYPPLVGIVSPWRVPGDKFDAAVTGRGPRSLTAVEFPLDISQCGRGELEALPNIGRARAQRLLNGKPYESPEDIRRALDPEGQEIGKDIIKYFRA